jgi:hypothetical protein
VPAAPLAAQVSWFGLASSFCQTTIEDRQSLVLSRQHFDGLFHFRHREVKIPERNHVQRLASNVRANAIYERHRRVTQGRHVGRVSRTSWWHGLGRFALADGLDLVVQRLQQDSTFIVRGRGGGHNLVLSAFSLA